ncbi:BAG family molecular chaperone regulator 4-like [Prosopis cineraria]|uniref:BAG family molecular chaperone regulator 4-like n=1 Tax=Prosopis cineraria TaxID=364024 RepID=UPI00240F3503|nr:BAG family molecular chaperone regulator 4-like [Prosopis cineraria]
MKRSSAVNYTKEFNTNSIEWELRPGGMLVQKRQPLHSSSSSSSSMINIKVSYGSHHHHSITLSPQSTFGDLKRALESETGLKPEEQRLIFRGKEKEDEERLDMVGVKDMSKIILLEDPASRDRKLKEIQKNEDILKASESVSIVRSEVDKLSEKVGALERTVNGGTKVAEKEFVILTELLMVQLLKLDSIEADGEAKAERRIEVRRVQDYVETLDNLKARNCNAFTIANNNNKAVSVSTKWEIFQSSTTVISHNWELFD